jgi:hypothetical protein
LDEIAQSAIEIRSQGAEDFQNKFFRRWGWVEFAALHTHLQTRFGLSVRDELLTRGPSAISLDAYVSAMHEAAERLRNEP